LYNSLDQSWEEKTNTTELDSFYWFTTVGMKDRIYLFGKNTFDGSDRSDRIFVRKGTKLLFIC